MIDVEFIVMVLLCHPTPAIDADPEVKKAKLWIKKRYRDIRNHTKEKGNARFTDAEIVAKTEWLENYLVKSCERDEEKKSGHLNNV